MAQCSCGNAYKLTFSDDAKYDALCPACKSLVNRGESYLSTHEHTQSCITNNPIADLMEHSNG